MARSIDFSDGFETASAPTLGELQASRLGSFANDAAFVTNKGSAAAAGDAYYNSTNAVVKFYNGSAWIEVVSPSTATSGTILRGDGTRYVSSTATYPNTTTANRLLYSSATNTVGDLAAITASRALVSDSNGLPTHSSVTSTELGYVSGVTSAIQSQINALSAGATSPSSLNNLGLATSVGSNALTVSLKQSSGSDPSSGSGAVNISFRNATATSGNWSQISVTSALSMTVSSGSTLGHKDGEITYIYVYALNNAGTVELAVSSSQFDDGSIASTTAEGGAGAADSRNVLYSTTARSNVAIRLIGRLKSSQTTAGTWATAISEISTQFLLAKPAVNTMTRYHTSNGWGSTNTKIRKFSTNVATTGTGFTVSNDATNGFSVTINEAGVYSFTYDDAGSGSTNFGLSLNSSQLTTDFDSITTADRLVFCQTGAADSHKAVSWTGYLSVGDVVRPHGDGGAAPAQTARTTFTAVQINRSVL